MDPTEYPALAQRSVFLLMAALFKRHGVRGILVGAYALNANKVQRATFDVDFMVTAEDCAKLEPDMLRAGYSVFARSQAFVQFRSDAFGLRDIDLLIGDRHTIDRMINEGKEVAIAGEAFFVPSPRHLIAMKLHSISCNRERELRDLPDIMRLITENDIDPTGQEIREMFKKYNAGDLYQRIRDAKGR